MIAMKKIITLISILLLMVCTASSLNAAIPFLNKNKTSSVDKEPNKKNSIETEQNKTTSKENDVVSSYIADEISFELKKLKAELKHAKNEIRELKAKSEVWTNPLSIYNKEIILNNGTTVFGKIVYQDKEVIKAETLIGYLTINRKTVVRIVENITETPAEKIDQQITDEVNMQNNELSGVDFISNKQGKDGANVILLGNINEFKDKTGNTILTGEVKNIGNRRSDFVKINFIFRKDWQGETETMTAFVKGSTHEFETGIVTDSSVLPGSTAQFELIIPSTFGYFIGYSYSLNWEEF